MADRALVTGFGPFLDVVDNPSGRLAEAVNGLHLAPGVEVHGLRLPVSYARAPALTLEAVARLEPRLVIGLGVAMGRPGVCVEALGRRRPLSGSPDSDGVILEDLEVDGPEVVGATAPAQALAQALGAVVSDDAGGYVCNAWLYRVLRGLEILPPARRPAAIFVHLPAQGLEPEVLCRGISSIWSALSTAASPPPTLS